jgi:hypothetical protein
MVFKFLLVFVNKNTRLGTQTTATSFIVKHASASTVTLKFSSTLRLWITCEFSQNRMQQNNQEIGRSLDALSQGQTTG